MTDRTGNETPRQRRTIAGLTVAIVTLHVLGFGLLLGVVVPAHLSLGEAGIFGVGVGITAYTLGMRHAFDVDHIAAIDNVTRKLRSEGRRAASVGFYFALGHSTIVFVLAAALALGVKGLSTAVMADDSHLQHITGLLGPTISGIFLLAIGVVNLVALTGIAKVFVRMRRDGHEEEEELEAILQKRGLMNRVLGRRTRAVTRPRHMYPVGILFGLGFDTATEIGLLATAGTAAASGLPFYAILALPILFAAGMSLFDTIDSAFMNMAYGWADTKPVRKIFYNLTITGLSVMIALTIGTVELLQVITGELAAGSPVADAVNRLDLTYVGYFVVVLFVSTWMVSLAVWKIGRIEEKWSVGAVDRTGV